MSRVHAHLPALAVGKALHLIPGGLRELVACEFVIGVDPVFAGIHHFTESDTGWAYRDIAHCVQDFHQEHRPRSDRGTKVVLPTNRLYRWDAWHGVRVVIHELGHVLHERVDESFIAEPVTEYARTNHHEAFAEAFDAWVWGEPIDRRTEALFERVAFG